MDLDSLPTSWVITSLATVCSDIKQKTPELDEQLTYIDIASIDRHLKAITEPQLLIGKDAPSRARKIVQTNDVLVSMTRPNLNAVAIVKSGLINPIASTGFDVLRANQVHPQWIFFQVRNQTFIEEMSDKVQGALYPAVKSADIRSYEIPLPPHAEQQEIATRLDALLAQVDTIKARLDAIPAILKRFRQSVLAAAVSGRLTEDWRNDSNYIGTNINMLIPQSWQLLSIDDVAEVKGGKRLPKGEELLATDTGYPYIRTGQLKSGTVITEGQLYLKPEVQKQISRYIVNTGDIYITIVGACIGDAGIIPEAYDGANLTENAAKICNFKKKLNNQYFSIWLRSQFLQDIISFEIKSGAQGKLALHRIKSLPFSYPCIEEQTEIVKRVEQLFAFADQIEQQVQSAQNRVNNLTQAILAKAFKGELTAEWRAQNPELISGENSAAALLEQIQQTAKPTKTKAGKTQQGQLALKPNH
ncbi:restriction endonuclease subunit S [Thiolinea disciformis]|uniref:restriction endonuclease subunit S n=1 Tax=Thiolinea disciformis TaxID=125614 RepID=UPI000366F640|nr:restriction endonuclease subunit S [Thiolinea disciformis]